MLSCVEMDNNNLSPNIGLTVGAGNNNNSSENIYIDIPTPSTRSVSPLSSVSPGRDKSFGFFQNIYRKIGLKSSEDINNDEENFRSSSLDSSSSISDRLQASEDSGSNTFAKSIDPVLNSELSSASSDSVCDSSRDIVKSLRSRRSSVRKLLESLTIATTARTRSLSCSSTSVNFLNQKSLHMKAESKSSLFSTNSGSVTPSNTTSKPSPKKILRRPVSYTYLRGISGLPTQRVPRSSICCSYYVR
ncbi:uncharacterized protein LOC129768953 [Toxorhynchites rutilus septentrionalis]|uniref:uncharacterized protein LOC129768953 n=1 Tax=Toxorhynchites rutilus septentrionalis TaxID=329112 RepID=UPI00247B05BA|nr:uncharacterized protein LOC129768953 [Toxorhynchites rutilus septentrionalis]